MHDRLETKSERIAIPGLENEYMVGLDVFHQLHCLVSFSESRQKEKWLTQETEYNSKSILPETI
jgi:hypothetical protein